MFACIFVPDFVLQASLWAEPEAERAELRKSPVVILDGPASVPRIIALNLAARSAGLELAMTKAQAETWANVSLRKRCEADEEKAQSALLECAAEFSPRVESTSPGTVIFDLTGTERLLGPPERVAVKIKVRVYKLGFDAQIALAANPDAALHAARGFSGITIIPAGREAARLGQLPLDVLPISQEMLDVLHSWGIHTFSTFAALEPVAITERLGQEGLHLQKLARGETSRPLRPLEVAADFVENFEFDDPVETLESLTFILNRLIQQLCTRLAEHSLATNELRLILELEVRQLRSEEDQEHYEHTWKLPFPVQDGKVLVRLVYLDLEAKTFSAPVRKLSVQVVPVKPQVVQGGLFTPPSPEAQQLEITLARIRGLVGTADAGGVNCAGSPQVFDSHKPDSFNLQAFSTNAESAEMLPAPVVVLRRFRPARETSVELSGQKPHFVAFRKRYLRVLSASGPWRSSGQWWDANTVWARQEWDVALKTAEGIGYYRLFFDEIGRRWFVEGVFD